jgi:hypothetical protein
MDKEPHSVVAASITPKQQLKGCGMIVEDHDMSDRCLAFGDGSRRDHEDSLLSHQHGVRQSVGSNLHHSLLKHSKIDIARSAKSLLASVERITS